MFVGWLSIQKYTKNNGMLACSPGNLSIHNVVRVFVNITIQQITCLLFHLDTFEYLDHRLMETISRPLHPIKPPRQILKHFHSLAFEPELSPTLRTDDPLGCWKLALPRLLLQFLCNAGEDWYLLWHLSWCVPGRIRACGFKF